MTSVVQSEHDPKKNYYYINEIKLSTESGEYSYRFFMQTDENADLVFFIGGQGTGTVYIDNIVLKKIINKEKEIDYPAVIPNVDYSNLILYEIFPSTYNGTWGNGECLNAIIDRLDQIKQLGINCLWINPVFEGEGGGYWTYDYYKISHRLGTLNDMKRLVHEAHKRDMLVIIDLVINHIWIQHPFFQDVIAKGSSSTYADWFLWFGEPGASRFDIAILEPELANINFDNPNAKEYMFTVAEYWMKKLDIDGYRVDTALFLEDRHPGVSRELINRLEKIKPDVFMLAEGFVGDKIFFNNGYDTAYDYDIRSTDWFRYSADSLNKVFKGTMTL
jgi:glycosidase